MCAENDCLILALNNEILNKYLWIVLLLMKSEKKQM